MSNIMKSAHISKAGSPDESQMALINAQAVEPLSPGDVFTFDVVMCDDQVDRDFEHFSAAALDQMAAMFVGKTVIKDHRPTADNQVARIYDTRVVDMADHRRALVGSAYMLSTEANADIIADIKGGIRREVSVSVGVGAATCSVCGTNNVKTYCPHLPGRTYDDKICTFELGDVTDAYELSFVGVPAQRGAGVTKSYIPGAEVPQAPDGGAAADAAPDEQATVRLSARLRADEAWRFVESKNEEE